VGERRSTHARRACHPQRSSARRYDPAIIPRYTGTSVQRVEDPRLLSGRGRFVDDLAVRDLLHVAFRRSDHPHGLLRNVDTSAARALPGVVAVWHGRDLPPWLGSLTIYAPPGARYPAVVDPLPSDKVRFVGDPVAMVVATSRAIAEDACDLIDVDIAPLPPIVTPAHALDSARPALFADAGTNVVYDETFRYGDPDGAFGRASHVVRRTLQQSRQTNLPMEGRAGLATFDAGRNELVYHAAHQNHHALRVSLASQLDLPLANVRVECGDIGGSFGQKAYPTREDVMVCAAARALARPVKWVEDRAENLLAAGHARDEVIDAEAAVDADGRILGVRVGMTLDQGAYPLGSLPSTIFPSLVRVLFPGPYAIDDYEFRGRVIASNKASYVAYRGPWEAETFARERLLDAIASDLGLDPVEVRRRNLLPADAYPRHMVTGPTQEGITVGATLERTVARIDLEGLRRAHDARRGGPLVRGVGIAVCVEPAPGPPDYGAALGAGASPRGAQQATARLDPDGRVVVATSQNPHGQSHHTTLAQLAADSMGVAIEQVTIVSGDTATTPFNLVSTGGSRAATLASGAVRGAVGELRARVLDLAADRLEAAVPDLDIVEGTIRVRGTPHVSVVLRDIARVHAPIDVTFTYDIPPGGWSQATHSCVVEVDIETGIVRVLRYLVVGDCGRIVNPAIVAGQIRGGVAQGIGSVLFERFVYDDDGQPRTTTLLDYLVPLASDLPDIEVEHLELATHGEHEFRGVGEGGAIASPAALVAAIEDALSHLGVRLDEQHLPPWRLCELMVSQAQHPVP
jgi:carbon-monoxide dehydrogenase large subunit